MATTVKYKLVGKNKIDVITFNHKLDAENYANRIRHMCSSISVFKER